MAKKEKQEAPQQEASQETPKKRTAKKLEGVWNCNLYIRGIGRVNQGDDTTPEAVAMLKDNASKYVV